MKAGVLSVVAAILLRPLPEMAAGERARAVARSGRVPWELAVMVVQGVGVYLFASGFLCTRQELTDVASCADTQAECLGAQCGTAYTGPPGCEHGAARTLPDFRIVVLLIVDALRFDFAPEFPTIARALHSRPERARGLLRRRVILFLLGGIFLHFLLRFCVLLLLCRSFRLLRRHRVFLRPKAVFLFLGGFCDSFLLLS